MMQSGAITRFFFLRGETAFKHDWSILTVKSILFDYEISCYVYADQDKSKLLARGGVGVVSPGVASKCVASNCTTKTNIYYRSAQWPEVELGVIRSHQHTRPPDRLTAKSVAGDERGREGTAGYLRSTAELAAVVVKPPSHFRSWNESESYSKGVFY